jgi:hypothetical protein
MFLDEEFLAAWSLLGSEPEGNRSRKESRGKSRKAKRGHERKLKERDAKPTQGGRKEGKESTVREITGVTYRTEANRRNGTEGKTKKGMNDMKLRIGRNDKERHGTRKEAKERSGRKGQKRN